MRPKVILIVLISLIAIFVLVRETQITQRLETLSLEKDRLVAERDATRTRLNDLETKLSELTIKAETPASARTDAALQQALARVSALETQLQNISRGNSRRVPWRPTFSEYDPTKPPPPVEPTQPPTNTVPKRAWGQEQITGPPDTNEAGDIQTAWASREPDAGPEWLWVDFERAMDLAEVRVRETYNPGAISKVTAVVNGQEVLLWEGTAGGGQAPRDFVVPVTGSISAQSVVVHLDTTRVQGWNEIDAVELVGRDGSRQWANAVNASSSYADRSGANPAANTGEQEVIFIEPLVPQPTR